jgi:hypothetical protein
MLEMRNGLSGRAAAARAPACGRIKPPAKSRFRTPAVAEDEGPQAGAETVLVSLDEADAGEDINAVVTTMSKSKPATRISSRRRKRISTMSATSSMARSETKKNADVWLVKRDP